MKNLLKPLFSVALLALTIGFANVQSAKADLVTFNTVGTFSNGSNTITFGSGANTTTLTFAGSTNTVNTPSNSNFGDIIATSTGTGAAVTGGFTLTFNVTSPIIGSDTAAGTLSGSLATNQSTAFLLFNDATANVQGITFTVNQPAIGIALVPPTTGAGGAASPGTTTIQGQVTGGAAPIPEPATMILLGTGLAGVIAKVRRRRRRSDE